VLRYWLVDFATGTVLHYLYQNTAKQTVTHNIGGFLPIRADPKVVPPRIAIPVVPAWLRWSLVVGTAAVILYFSIVPPPSGSILMGPFGLINLSYWLHLLVYLGLSIVLAYAFQPSPRPDWQILLAVFTLAVGYGVGIQLIQLQLPTEPSISRISLSMAWEQHSQ
jgi:hypothetical protein